MRLKICSPGGRLGCGVVCLLRSSIAASLTLELFPVKDLLELKMEL